MQTSASRARTLAATVSLITILVSSCGGGGGGGGGSTGGGSTGGGSRGTLTLDNYNLSFTTNDPAASPAAQQIRATISPAATGTVYIRIVVAGEIVLDVSNITVTSDTTGTADIGIPDSTTASLGPGEYAGTIQVTVCTSGPDCTSGLIGTTQTANVIYTINGVTTTANALDFTIRDSSVIEDYSQQVAIQAYPAYNATVDDTWLSASPASGDGSVTEVSVDLDRATIDASVSGAISANLTVSVDGANSVTVPVNTSIEKPQFDHVSPYIGLSGVANTVVVRGKFLDDLNNTQIDFAPDLASAGTLADAVQVISPTELRVSHPALAAGRYIVRMYDDMGAVRDRSGANLVVIDDPGFAADFISYPNNEVLHPNSVVYDAERQSLLMTAYRDVNGLDVDDNVVMRFEFDGAWNAPDVVNVPRARALALSVNGQELLVASETPLTGNSYQARLDLFNPDLTEIYRTVDTQRNGAEYMSVAITSDNRAIMLDDSPSTSGSVDVHTYSFETNEFSTVSGISETFEDWSTIASSANGQRMFISSPPDSSGEYDVPNDLFMTIPINSDHARLDRHGDLLGSQDIDNSVSPVRFDLFVYDRNWTLLGEVQSEVLGWVLSPDGTRLYTYSQGAILRTFDLTAMPVGGQYPEIGTGTVLAGDPGDLLLMKMAITPDGNTVFVVSSDGIAVQPVN